MKKFRRFLGRISAETCLKMDKFGSKSQKLPSVGSSAPDPLVSGGWRLSPRFRLDSMTRECARPYFQ